MEENNFNGAIPDTRPEEQKALDWTHIEVLGGTTTPGITWTKKTTWTTLDKRNQITSSSCGAQSSAKGLTYFNDALIMSASPIYRARINYPSGGMALQDIGRILVNKRTTTESICPSEMMTEEQMNAVTIPSTLPYGISAYYILPSASALNMDLLAQALELGNSLVIGIGSNDAEYSSVPVNNGQGVTFNHFVCTVPDNYLVWTTGEKALVIDDSCAPESTLNQSGQRIFTESFLRTRSWGIMGLIPAIEGVQTKPKYTFNDDLTLGFSTLDSQGNPIIINPNMMNNPDVKALQDILKYEQCMPLDIPSTGNYGPLTKAAVSRYQVKYTTEILAPEGLTLPTGEVHQFTRDQLNKTYSQ